MITKYRRTIGILTYVQVCMISYHEEGTHEEHHKGIGKLKRLLWKIYWKVNQKWTSLVEKSLTEAGEW